MLSKILHISEMNSYMISQLEGINALSQRRWSRFQTLQALSAISAQSLM